MVVKWSSGKPFTPTTQVRIPVKPTVFLYNLCLKKKENKQKDSGVGPLKSNFSRRQVKDYKDCKFSEEKLLQLPTLHFVIPDSFLNNKSDSGWPP